MHDVSSLIMECLCELHAQGNASPSASQVGLGLAITTRVGQYSEVVPHTQRVQVQTTIAIVTVGRKQQFMHRTGSRGIPVLLPLCAVHTHAPAGSQWISVQVYILNGDFVHSQMNLRCSITSYTEPSTYIALRKRIPLYSITRD